MSTEHRGPAMQNRAQHFQMQPGEPTLAALEETLSGCADNVSHLHGWRRHLLGLGGPATVAEDCQRIQRADGRVEVSLRNVQINRGLFNVAVTQQYLKGSQVYRLQAGVWRSNGEGCADVRVSGYGNVRRPGGRPTRRLYRR
jgi:hypothetical protein